jgi:hypothetical protein
MVTKRYAFFQARRALETLRDVPAEIRWVHAETGRPLRGDDARMLERTIDTSEVSESVERLRARAALELDFDDTSQSERFETLLRAAT